MKKPLVIGLVGRKKSGKTTTLNRVRALAECEELMLAGHLKWVGAEVFCLPLQIFEDQNLKEKEILPHLVLEEDVLHKIFELFELKAQPADMKKHAGKVLKTPRQAMQYIGTEVLRAKDPDIHIKWSIKKSKPQSKLLVVSDIRFPNEFDYFHKNTEMISVGIERPNQTNEDLHESEVHIPALIKRCDVILVNNAALKDLEEKIDSLLLPKIQAKLS